MNYNIRLCGNSYSNFEEIVKLLMISAGESDYQVSVYTHKVDTLFSAVVIDVSLVGSAIQIPTELVVDFVDSYPNRKSENNDDAIDTASDKAIDKVSAEVSNEVRCENIIDAKSLDLQFDKRYRYQWGILGAVMCRVSDLSPAFVTSYLLESRQDKELQLFKKFFT